VAETNESEPAVPENQPQSPSAPRQQRTVTFDEIAGGSTEVVIKHAGQTYRLRSTKNGRLLLNK